MLTWGGRVTPAPRDRAGVTRRMLRVSAIALLLLLASTAVPVTAAPRGGTCPPGSNDCWVWDDEPGTPGGGDNGGGGPGGGDGGGGGPAKCQRNGVQVPCYDELLGWFNSADGCYYKLQEPQPDDTPEGKQYYLRSCGGEQEPVLLDAPPGGFGDPPDPEELARAAFAKLTLEPPHIGIAPRKRNGPGLVGLPIWMWTIGEDRDPPSESASDRGITVTIRAKAVKTVWDMDNGDKVTCPGAGTAYSPTGDRAGQKSPDCGYDGYQQARTYRITATTHWVAHWQGGDMEGDIPTTRTSNPVTIQINELQVVTE